MFKCTYWNGTGGCAASVMADDVGVTTDCQGCAYLADVEWDAAEWDATVDASPETGTDGVPF